jgi:hypothetical protein
MEDRHSDALPLAEPVGWEALSFICLQCPYCKLCAIAAKCFRRIHRLALKLRL